MEAMRVPPYPITTTWTLPEANHNYVQEVEDMVDHSLTTTEVVSDDNNIVSYILTAEDLKFDRKLYVRFYDAETESLVYEEGLDVVRPYVDANKFGTTASEIEEYKVLEAIARSVIDTVVTDGFYNYKKIIQTVGQGSDYFPLWVNVNKILQVYENNKLVYDVNTPDENEYEYILTLDNSAVQRVIAEQYNRSEQTPPNIPVARGDLGYYGYTSVAFPSGYDYTFIVDAGYKSLPSDVESATKFLIEDIKCGKLDYYKRYVSSYNTEQFRIQFDKAVFDGTGNLLVDKILDKYSNTILKPGII